MFKTTDANWKVCRELSLWGDNSNFFRKWEPGYLMVFYTDNGIVGIGEYAGKSENNEENLWDSNYPHRTKFKLIKVVNDRGGAKKNEIQSYLKDNKIRKVFDEINHPLYSESVSKAIMKILDRDNSPINNTELIKTKTNRTRGTKSETSIGTDDSGNLSVLEAKNYKLHLRMERKQYFIKEAKKYFNEGDRKCQICGFSFFDVWKCDYIEAHHIDWMSEDKVPRVYGYKDLMFLCSNCHSAIHKLKCKTIDEMRVILRGKKDNKL